MNIVIDKPALTVSTVKPVRSRSAQPGANSQSAPPPLVQEVFETLVDGILIVNNQGQVIYANTCAHRLCGSLMGQTPSPLDRVPLTIWAICQRLVGRQPVLSPLADIIDDEIETEGTQLRVRVRWMELPTLDDPHITVTLEDRCQSLHNVVMMEAHNYRLTKRETEVWALKRRDFPYKDIAAHLHISVDTVKKHVKNIHAKRDQFYWEMND